MLLGNLEIVLVNKTIDIVILSDYGKGVFTNGFAEQAIELCNKCLIPTIVDPKDPPVDKWRGCTYFKPNAFESCKMTGLSSGNWWSHYAHFETYHQINNVVITDGPNTPFVGSPISNNNNIKLARQPKKQSVIGAGDCFCAFLSMCLSHKMKLEDAVEVGWNASSLYIESKHNKPIMPHELDQWNDPIQSKIVSVDDMARIMGYDKSTWVWTNGCFDILHVGHLKTLEAAKQFGDKVIVGLNTDSSIKELKGPNRPVNDYLTRAEHLAHCQYVDFIVPIEDKTPLEIIKKLKPTKIVKGNDYKVEDIAGADVVGHDNVHLVQLVSGLSTTKIIERIKL
jgi:D-beta-D-heptose 7-phosphate kinase/D-beta-D-heptose 1-phosphate adenosyltransferase